VRSAVLALLLAVAGVGFLRSLEEALEGFDRRGSRAGPPLTWRLGKAPAAALERCVEAAGELVPRGSVVAFAGPAEPPSQALLRWRWASYFLAGHDLVQYRGAETGGDPGYVVACRRALGDDGRLVEVARLPGGRLYRVRRGGGAEGDDR
jgi:hypothetical protein